MRYAMTGSSGFVGSRLRAAMEAAGAAVTALPRLPVDDQLSGADVVIHLAGEPVAQRWTREAKRRIRESRVKGTRHLVQALSTAAPRPAALICASAIGYYGDCGDEVLTEESEPGDGFLARVCVEWEREAQLAEALGMRVVRVRIGVVLHPDGGALAKMLPPFRLGAGGRLGSGRQWMSWIHIDDLVGLFLRASTDESIQGALNATAAEPVTNAAFTAALGRALHRPAVVPVPALALKLALGEMASMLLGSARVVPRAAQAAGYGFRYPGVDEALRQLLS